MTDTEQSQPYMCSKPGGFVQRVQCPNNCGNLIRPGIAIHWLSDVQPGVLDGSGPCLQAVSPRS